jgi:prepilin-type N-terminal cleavage/methylation domain-containing protein
MIRFRPLKAVQSGDTIVEVLISIAILSVILTGAYVTASHSLVAERDAQEHAVASTIAQSEVEDLASGYTLSVGDNCFSTNNPANVGSISAGTDCSVESNNQGSGPVSATTCASSGAPYCYTIVMTSKPLTHSVNYPSGSFAVNWITYTVTVTWPSLNNGATDSVQLFYRPN